MIADYCIKGNAIYTGLDSGIGEPEESLLYSGCVLINGDRILDVCSDWDAKRYIGENTVVIDAGDRLVMPGFIDAHTHFFSGAIAASEHVCTEIADSTSEEECVRILAAYAGSHPEETRIRGRGWFVTNWGDAPLPTKDSLDEVFPNIPVYLQAADVHSYWLNSAALEECGITKEMAKDNANILLLPNGELQGMLLEIEACKPADEKYHAFTREERLEIYRNFMELSASYGVTSLSEMMPYEYDPKTYERYWELRILEELAGLTARVHIYTKLYDTDDFTTALEWKRSLDSDYVKISGVKGFIDGVAETYTGLLLEPYTDRPDTCGLHVPFRSQRELSHAVTLANQAGLPVRIHCIADGSVRMALNAFEEAYYRTQTILPNTIEHIETIHPDDMERFRSLHVIPSMQPIHLLLDADGKIARVGNERIKWEWPTKTMLDICGTLAIGTDYPVVSLNPFDNIYAAVTRKNYDGSDASHNAWERLSVAEALKGYTSDAAKAYNRGHEIGSLKAGMFADVIILDRNLFSTPEEEIPNCKVEMTMVGGRVVYLSSES